MEGLKVALVSRDASERLAVASAFDAAPSSWDVSIHTERPDEADVVVLGSDVASERNGDEFVLFDSAKPDRALEAVKKMSAEQRSRRFLVTGAGRGVGVTSLTVQLAESFARAGSTCLLDLDVDRGLEARLGFEETAEMPDRFPLAAHPVRGGFRVVFARHCAAETNALVDDCAGRFDRLLIDRPAPLRDGDLASLSGAVLVLAPTPAGIARTKSILEKHEGVTWALVVNRLGPGGEMTRSEVERAIGHRVAVELPCCPALRDAEERSKLLTSRWFRYVRRIDALSRALVCT